MLNVIIVAVALLVASYLAFSKRLAASSNWKATVTPLASIMGSGFLVSAPLLAGVVGNLAVVCMALLLGLAFLVGGAIRFNIRHFEPIEHQGHGPAQSIAFVSRLVLAEVSLRFRLLSFLRRQESIPRRCTGFPIKWGMTGEGGQDRLRTLSLG